MKHILTALLLSVVLAIGQAPDQWEIRKFTTNGMNSFWITGENSKAFGLNGSGVPSMLAVGGSSTLAGLSDVALSSLANLDLLRYDLASGKWVNATIASLDLLTATAAASAYQPASGTLTTLSSATAAGLALMDDASASAQRTTLGLGTAATATIATAVTNNAVPTIHNAAGSPDRGITGISSTGKIVFSTPTGTGSPVWAVSPSLQGSPTIGAGSGSFSSLKFYDSNGGTGDNYIGLRAPNDVTSDLTFILPATDGTSGQSLTTNGSGALSFSSVAGLGANTFTALQAITQATANAGIIASTGYSLTGSNATSMIDLAGTWNTSGSPAAILVNITNTASGSSSRLLDLQVGGTSRVNYNVSDGYLKVKNNDGYSEWGGLWGGAMDWKLYGVSNMTLFAGGALNLNYTSSFYSIGNDTIWRRDASNTWQAGTDTATNSATAPAQTIKGPDATGTTSTGGSLTLAGGTGTSAGGSVILATSATTTPATAVTVNNNAVTSFAKPPVVPVYTVATLPATAAAGMVQGAHAVVTDATAPTYLGALTGGGAVVCPVFYNGTAWVSH